MRGWSPVIDQLANPEPLVVGVALLAGAGVTVAHGIAHNLAGNRSMFDAAGVGAAGVTVFAAATTATYIVLTLAGGAM